jgi:hypothetical protein
MIEAIGKGDVRHAGAWTGLQESAVRGCQSPFGYEAHGRHPAHLLEVALQAACPYASDSTKYSERDRFTQVCVDPVFQIQDTLLADVGRLLPGGQVWNQLGGLRQQSRLGQYQLLWMGAGLSGQRGRRNSCPQSGLFGQVNVPQDQTRHVFAT